MNIGLILISGEKLRIMFDTLATHLCLDPLVDDGYVNYGPHLLG